MFYSWMASSAWRYPKPSSPYRRKAPCALKIGNITLFSGSALGDIEITAAGMVGYVELTIAVGSTSSGIGLEGRFSFELNTTASDSAITRFKMDKDGNVIPNGSGGFVMES